MDKYNQEIVYAIIVGAILAILFFLSLYQHPKYNIDIVQSDFHLVTQEEINLGWAFSTISLRYYPDRTIGRFYINIQTEVSEPYWRHSVSSKDIIYRISFWWKSRLIEQVEGNYLGSLNPESGRIMFSGFSLPSINRPMTVIRSRHGKMKLSVEGTFFNVTNNEVIANKTEDFHLFIIHPNVKLLTFSLFIAISGIAVIERIGPKYKVKNIWEKKSRIRDILERLMHRVFIMIHVNA